MKKKILAVAIASLTFGANAASMNGLKISGFGSIGIGHSDNAVGYAGYTDDNVEWEHETLAGLQFDFKINDNAKFVTQFVSNSRYGYDLKVEMAYAAYEFEALTVRTGKLRLPLFFYSDYIDVSYAYPMMRPSPELYSNIVLKSHTGIDMLIPIDLGDTTLVLQPLIGVGTIDEDDSTLAGEVKLDKLFGLSANWNIDDFTIRSSYISAEANPTDLSASDGAAAILDEKGGQFISIGAQYDNGDLLVNVEAADVQIEGLYSDYQSVSALIGYRISQVTPYLSSSWVQTTDDEERTGAYAGYAPLLSYERISYSAGTRWDFARNMALKFDLTYVDYLDTAGGFGTNLDDTGQPIEDSSIVYSAKLDVVF